jgi:hypothetical protein
MPQVHRIQLIRIVDVWDHGFTLKKAFVQREGRDDFVTFSDAYTEMLEEPVWFYSWGNTAWLRCPVKRFVSATIRRCVDFAHGPGWAWEIYAGSSVRPKETRERRNRP